MFDYYIVVRQIQFNKIDLPEFFNCALINDKFVIISDLTEYLKTGKGLSNITINEKISFFKVNLNGKNSMLFNSLKF